jgi:hypothetical protein
MQSRIESGICALICAFFDKFRNIGSLQRFAAPFHQFSSDLDRAHLLPHNNRR